MITIEYKILFEVRFLHDYYLTDRTGNSYYSLTDEAQSSLIEERLKKERYDIHTDIELLLSQETRTFLKNHRMKLVKTKLGFFVGMEVDAEKSGGGKLIYRPVIPPKNDAELIFGLGTNNPLFQNLTNLPFATDENDLLYFTNTGEKEKNILSQPIAELEEGQDYHMGDLSKRDDHIYKAIDKNSGNIDFWQQIAGDGFVHQGDLSPIRQEQWFQDWLLDLTASDRFPFAVLKISLNAENPELSPIKDNGYLTTEFLPSQSRPQHPVFELRFLARTTYWRYKKAGGFSLAERNHIQGHAGDLLDFEKGDFVTKTPHFLAAEVPYITSNTFRLPSAKPYLVKYEGDKVYSDIFFNAINPIPDEV
jgi:hypothetical protein